MEANLPARPLIGLLLRLVYQHYAQDIDAALRDAGFDDIRPAAANVFPFVRPEGVTVSELAELAQVRKQTMAQAVDQLERTGYVERRPDPTDRRVTLIHLTARGWEEVRAALKLIAGLEQRWSRRLGKERMEELRSLLTELGQPDT